MIHAHNELLILSRCYIAAQLTSLKYFFGAASTCMPNELLNNLVPFRENECHYSEIKIQFLNVVSQIPIK